MCCTTHVQHHPCAAPPLQPCSAHSPPIASPLLQYVAAIVASAQEAAAEQLVLVTSPGAAAAAPTGFSLFGAPKAAPSTGGAKAGPSEQLVSESGLGYVCIRAAGLEGCVSVATDDCSCLPACRPALMSVGLCPLVLQHTCSVCI